VFKFANSIDHCSLTKYRSPLNFKLLDCPLQDAPLMYNSHPVALLGFEKNEENLKKQLLCLQKMMTFLKPPRLF
jgi:hypothetical protein